MSLFVGVFSQPKNSLQKWKDRGINILIASEPENNSKGVATVPQAAWRAEARRLGLPYYDRPSGDYEADKNDPYLLGFLMDDEPDRRIVLPAINSLKKETDPAKRAALQKSIDDYVAWYKSIAEKCRATGKPVLGNFSGPDITAAQPWYKCDGQKPFLPLITEIAADWYVKNKNADRYPNSLVAQQFDLLAYWNKELGQPDKPYWAFLECSYTHEQAVGRAPTPDEIEEQLSLVSGRKIGGPLKGIIWFCQSFNPFKFDNLVEPQLSKVIEINRRFNPIPAPLPKMTADEAIAKIEQILKQFRG